MYSLLLLLALLTMAIAEPVKKSPVDLLREGRMMEAQKILEMSDAPERYNLLLDALREPNAIEACFLYREISARFPGTDCDEFAQERLLQAASMGIDISALVLEAAPSAEPGVWPDAAPESYEVERPLIASTKQNEIVEVQVTPVEQPVSEPVAIATKEPVIEKPIAIAPKIETPVVSKLSEDPKPITSPAESATLDYSAAIPAKKDTGIVVASLTGDPTPQNLPKKEPEKKVKANPEATKPHDIDAQAPDGWYIQVGAFGNHENAHKLATRLRTAGYKVFLVTHENLLQVRVGTFATKEEGRAIGDKIKAAYNVPAVLVTVP